VKRIIAILLALSAVGSLLPALVVLADHHEPGGGLVVEKAVSVNAPTEDNDLAVVSFEKLFAGTIISGDTAAFSFEIVNQGKLPNTASWKMVSNNTTSDTGDDITVASGDTLLDSGFSVKTGPGGISWNTKGAKTGDHAVTLSVAPVPGETTTGNNSKVVTVSIIEKPTRDVAVTDIIPISGDGVTPVGTADVPSGTILKVKVTTQNRGSVTDTFVLDLKDNTDNRTIANLNVTVDPGDVLTLGLPWNTSGASSGDHTLTAKAVLTGDENTGDNTRSTTVPVKVILAQFTTNNVEQLLKLGLEPITIPTEVMPVTARFMSGVEQTLELSYQSTTILTEAMPVTAIFFNNVEQVFNLTYQPTTILTEVMPFTTTFFSGIEQDLSLAHQSTTVPTEATPLTALFTNGVEQSLTVGFGSSPLVTQARIRSQSVSLQGRPDSTGAFLRVGGQVQFVAADGSFDFLVPPGTYDIIITAPGYIYVALMNIALGAGDVLTVPDITLPFGDANGDGFVDILDLGFLNSNLHEHWREITP